MFATDDTIVAVATPAGRGALGVIRISGPCALKIVQTISSRRSPLEPRRATLTRIVTTAGATSSTADSVIATYFQAPQSYTGDDVVELSAHGSPVILRGIVSAAMEAGARLARPGEFTLRAFLSGRIDLVQAEAVADLIASATPLQARVAFDQLEGTLTRRIAALDTTLFDLIARLEASLDFPDEGYHFIDREQTRQRINDVVSGIDVLLADGRRGRVVRDGATVVLAGRPNVGKSSLFNALAGADRAIVTEVPGTTRDLITEPIDVHGIAVTLVDTAGARQAHDAVEREGVVRGQRARGVADLILVVIDGSLPLSADDHALLGETAASKRLILVNKGDLPHQNRVDGSIVVSAATGAGLSRLRSAIAAELGGSEARRETPAVTNLRHIGLLQNARECLERAVTALAVADMPEEFLLADLHAARARFDEVVGVRTTDDILAHIFAKFCIGK